MQRVKEQLVVETADGFVAPREHADRVADLALREGRGRGVQLARVVAVEAEDFIHREGETAAVAVLTTTQLQAIETQDLAAMTTAHYRTSFTPFSMAATTGIPACTCIGRSFGCWR